MTTETKGPNGAAQPLFAAGNLWNGWMKRGLAISQELSGFVMERVNEDVAAWAELAECKNPLQLMERQQQLVQKAIADYAAEGQKITQMMMAPA